MKNTEIKVVAYVHVGDKLVNVDDLDDKRRAELATRIKTTYLNGLFQGQAVFHPMGRAEPARKAP